MHLLPRMNKRYRLGTTRILAGLFVSILLISAARAQTPLFVNEIMASNKITNTDDTGAAEDWFEIYNPNDVVVDLAGYYVSDKTASPKKHQIPTGFAETRIQPHGYLIIWASEEPERGPLHASFALSTSGENVVLSAPDGMLVDVVTFDAQTTDVSYGRATDGAASWLLFSGATPGASNSGGVTLIPRVSPPVFSVAGGFKTAGFPLSITHSDPSVRIRYTTDGSEPTDSDDPIVWQYKNEYKLGLDAGLLNASNQSFPYTTPIQIADRSSQPNRLSIKGSTYQDGAPVYIPVSPVYKGTVVRAKAFKTGNLPSETITNTYFVSPLGGGRYSMPVISLVSDERSFYDYTTGIYTAGREYDKAPAHLTGSVTANFMKSGADWERRGSFALFENGNQVFSQENVGMRTHGNFSRVLPQKSLRIYSDTDLNYNFFPGQNVNPKRILLRTKGNEENATEITDLFCQKLVEYLPIDSQGAKPAVIFLNGEYYGFQAIRERLDRYYLENKYDVDTDDVDLIKIESAAKVEVEEGDDVAYQELLSHVNNNKLSETVHYEKLKSLIDLENYTDYYIAQTFLINMDWPNTNIRLWRTRTVKQTPGSSPEYDGRWRVMLYDTDYAFYTSPEYQNFTYALSGIAPFATIFSKLLENEEYKKFFISRLADLLNTHFTAARSSEILEEMRGRFAPLMQENIDRWTFRSSSSYIRWAVPSSIEIWNSAIATIQTRVTARPGTYRNNIRAKFGSGLANQNLTLSVSNVALGYVRVNKIDITSGTPGVAENPYPWTGIYFKTIPIQLTAVPKPDAYFLYWIGPNGFKSTQAIIDVLSDADDLQYHAVFAQKPMLANLAVNGGALSPGFTSAIKDYQVSIPSTTTSVTVTPTFGDRAHRALINANKGSNVSIANLATSAPMTMAPGNNKVYLQVYDVDGFGANFYTLNVNRQMQTPGYAFNFAGSKSQAHLNELHYVKIDKRIETPNFTLEAWIRTSENSATGTQGFQASALFDSDQSGQGNDFTMGILNNKISFYDGSVGQSTLGTKNVVDGRWHHVAVVREAMVAVRIYVDGVLDVENTNGAGRATLNENSYIALGGNPGLAAVSFQGSMDEVRIWTTARTLTEVSQNMHSPVPTNSPGLKAYYNFDIGVNDETTTVPDLTGNGNTGTIGNMLTTRIGRSESYAMVVPAPAAATDVSASGFTANWTAPVVGTVEHYFLDVSTSKTFEPGSFLAGYESLQVNGTSKKVTLPSASSGRTAASDYYYRVRADQTSTSGQGGFSATVMVANPLPVTLISFTGKKSEFSNLLQWRVTAETGFDRYQIERSYDAKTYEGMGTVKAMAENDLAITTYSFSDTELPLFNAETLYYRLKMIDKDGSFAYSRSISISNGLPGAEIGPIYPNPSNGKTMYVNITVNDSDTWNIGTFSSAGTLISANKIALKKGTIREALPIEHLRTGIYLISFTNGMQQRVSRKIIID
jgi:hypothetical protein